MAKTKDKPPVVNDLDGSIVPPTIRPEIMFARRARQIAAEAQINLPQVDPRNHAALALLIADMFHDVVDPEATPEPEPIPATGLTGDDIGAPTGNDTMVGIAS